MFEKKILLGIAMVFVFITPAMALEYKCYTKDGKTWECDMPIEKLLEDTEKAIIDSATEPTKNSISVFGTDYFLGETNATTFLQLLNSTNEPITNSTCFVSIWNPDKSVFISNATMSYLNEGLFYRDYNLPQDEGVYMISAKCTIPKLVENIGYFPNNSYDGLESGISGGYGWNSNWILGAGSNIQSSESYAGAYSLECEENAYATRSFDFSDGINMTVSFYAKFYSIDTNEYAYFTINDGTERIIDTWENGDDDDTWRYYQYNITGINPSKNTQIVFRTDFNSALDQAYFDEIYISIYKTNYTEVLGYEYQTIRGSGEIHVIDPISTIINDTSLLDEILWNFQFDRDANLVSNHDYCIDNQTLMKTLTYEYCLGSDCRLIQKNQTIPCEFGCENNACVQPNFNWIIVFVFIAIASIIVLKYKSFGF